MKCPVCEHEQAFGVECDLCGKVLGGIGDLGPPPVTVERVEGLEATMRERLGDVPVDLVGELEVTRYEAVTVAPDATPDVEHNQLGAVGDVPVERMAEMAVDRVPDDGQRTALDAEGPVTCRYCRHVQASGALCDRCGMKLPVVAAPPAIVGTLVGGDVDLKVRCRACGALARAGQRCGDCGQDVPFPDA